MRFDITDKLNFEDDPIIVIKNIELKINSNATTVLKLMALSKEIEEDMTKIIEALELLFDKSDLNKLNKLNLKMSDFIIVIQEAMNYAMGINNDVTKTP